MNNDIFRKSSMEKLNSPEQLNEYIRVAKPGVWVLLSAIVLLLLGAFAWGVFGIVETRIDCGALVENGRARCYVGAEDVEKIEPGDAVSIGDIHGTVTRVSSAPIAAGGKEAYLLRLSADEPYYAVDIEVPGLDAGVYPAAITVESLRPISFIIR